MRAGLLKYHVVIYRPTIQKDKYGGQTEDLKKIRSTRAQLVSFRNGRGVQNDEIYYDYDITIKIRAFKSNLMTQFNSTVNIFKDQRKVDTDDKNVHENDRILFSGVWYVVQNYVFNVDDNTYTINLKKYISN